MVSQRGRYLVGVWAKSSITVISSGANDLQPPADALNSLKYAAASARPRHSLRGAESGKRVGNIVQPGTLRFTRDDFTALAPVTANAIPPGEGTGEDATDRLRGGQAVGHA